MISTSSHVCSLPSRVHCMVIQSMTYFWADICSPGRRCCSTITLSLWKRRYDVCDLVLHQLHWRWLGRVDMDVRRLHLMNPASHWSILKGFDGGCQKSCSFWIAILSVRWYCASCAIYTHKRLTSSNDRLYSICKYWLHCTSRYEDLTIHIVDFIFPVSMSVSIP